MRRSRWLRVTVLLPVAILAFQTHAVAHELTFEQRVAAQEAIERVHYAHQIGATRPFGQAVPRELLERKVRTYLGQSLALERLWHTPVTAEMLQRELAPREIGAIGAVKNEREAYALRVVLDEQADLTTIAIYLFPKRTWEEWWSDSGFESRGTAVPVMARDDLALPRFPADEGDRCNADTWDNGVLDDLPPARAGHCAVSTGSRMIVWGASTEVTRPRQA